MLQIALCDDNKIHLQINEKLVKKATGDTECLIQTFFSAESLLSEIEKNRYFPDIAILDIEMSGEDGITLAKRMNEMIPQCRIIFLTSYQEYAQEAYHTEHVWFVLKKDADKYFQSAWNKAVKSLQENDSSIPGIVIREKGISFFIPLDQILYLSKESRKALIVCTDRDYHDTRRPALLIPRLLQKSFIRCHQGYWVNIQMIEALDHEEFILKNGSRIPISRTFREESRRQFFEKYR